MAQKDPEQIRREFGEAVNMTSSELERWLQTEESQSVGDSHAPDGDGGESTGHKMGSRIVELLSAKASDLSEDDHAAMNKVVGYVHRHLAQHPGGDVTNSHWRYSLMNWGHDPCKILAEPVRLDHFLAAQDKGVYEQALEEIRDGEKRSHWMWFVFPQIDGLGSSATAKKYALPNKAAARAYAAHDVLGDRLYEATEAMLEWAGAMSAEAILGKVDAMKFRSSMTLFEAACSDNEPFAQALDTFYDGKRDAETLKRL